MIEQYFAELLSAFEKNADPAIAAKMRELSK